MIRGDIVFLKAVVNCLTVTINLFKNWLYHKSWWSFESWSWKIFAVI